LWSRTGAGKGPWYIPANLGGFAATALFSVPFQRSAPSTYFSCVWNSRRVASTLASILSRLILVSGFIFRASNWNMRSCFSCRSFLVFAMASWKILLFLSVIMAWRLPI
jgi:hypothetical protein